jgi:GxxExxY protein
MSENEISKIIVDCAYRVHKELGPGLLESTYEACLIYELTSAGLKVESQTVLPVCYKGIKIDCGYRVDIVVENKVIIELKAVDALTNAHSAQLLTYLKLTNCRLGLLINFNMELIKFGIKRIVNKLTLSEIEKSS